TYNGSVYVPVSTNRFLYNGWNLVAEVNPANGPIRTYLWGNDLSGTMQGAGGVGGLLEVSCGTTNCFPAFDGNGNVAALINAADGTVLANYDYAAFGEPIRITGSMAKNNPFRFSTKYADDESDLLYYGYRYYKPSTGTWPSRDPIEEEGGLNLYAILSNDGIDDVDALGDRPKPTPDITLQVLGSSWDFTTVKNPAPGKGKRNDYTGLTEYKGFPDPAVYIDTKSCGCCQEQVLSKGTT